MTNQLIRHSLAATLLATGLHAHAQQGGAPVPYEGVSSWAAGEACAFPVELRAQSKIKVRVFLGRSQLITSFGKASTTFVNLAEPSKSITVRGGGTWHDTVSPDGSIIGRMTGHNFVIGGPYRISMFLGDWTVIIRADGQIYDPPVGTGQQVDLCPLIS